MEEFEITKREILASISNCCSSSHRICDIRKDFKLYSGSGNEKYNKAVKIEDSGLFEYGMRTNIGDAFIYGDLIAVDTVSLSRNWRRV